jgi:serine/threonine protein kinase
MIGSQFGSFEITGRLGAGGMGEVYRAHDPRLGRDVAIKVLPPAFVDDPERTARFEREARALAAVSHSNVGAIYGIEAANGRIGLVLELIDGPTLADILAAASRDRATPGLSASDVLVYGAQIAAGLEAAHDRGIIHRDLKPANIKITAHAVVKVLDFGLAKSQDEDRPAAEAVTRLGQETMGGLVLGTPRYMSPEQARGQIVRAQTDIWSFGCVLFEMLAGRPAFEGRTPADVLAAVLGVEPDWRRLPEDTRPGLRRLVQRCLRKDPHERLKHIGDARLDLEDERRTDSPAGVAPAASVVATLDVDVRRLTDSVGVKEHPVLSPDGKMVAFTAVVDGKRQIWIQFAAGGSSLQVTRDASDHEQPRWSPDSSRLIFYAPAKPGASGGFLWEVSALGGLPRRLVAALGGGDVSHDGARIAAFRSVGARVELFVSAIDGSDSRAVTDAAGGDATPESPRWAPDDSAIAFTVDSMAAFETRLLLAPVGGGASAIVARADWIRGHAWRPDGAGLIYSASTGSTMPYPPLHHLRMVDRDGRHDRRLTFGDASYLQPDMKGTGQVVAARARSRSDIWKFPVEGEPAENVRGAVRLTCQTGQVQVPSVSPDGAEFVYVSDHGGHSNLWLASMDGSSVRQLTFEREPATLIGVARWSSRGDRLAFIAAHHGRVGLRLVAADGTGVRPLVADGRFACWSGDGASVFHLRSSGELCRVHVDSGETSILRTDAAGPAVTPDGRVIYFSRRADTDRDKGSTGWEICRAEPIDGPAERIATIDAARLPFSPRFSPHCDVSPDGRWLALPLTDGGTTNLWLLPTHGGAARQVTDFGTRATLIVRWASWTPDGRHLVAAVAETDVDIVSLDGLV